MHEVVDCPLFRLSVTRQGAGDPVAKHANQRSRLIFFELSLNEFVSGLTTNQALLN